MRRFARSIMVMAMALTGACGLVGPPPAPDPSSAPASAGIEVSAAVDEEVDELAVIRRRYPWHENIVATTFWVGEVFEPGPNGSQVISAFDDQWMRHYGGCDGRVVAGVCHTEHRIASNGYYPRTMTPRQNPFYLDLPFDDVNDPVAARRRASVVPWAHDPAYRSVLADPDRSLMKNRWVQLEYRGRTCYGQIEDAGPGTYHDIAYVFGTARPANTRYGGAGMDVSPALTGCLGFADIDGVTPGVRWRFVEAGAVPDGPWRRTITVG